MEKNYKNNYKNSYSVTIPSGIGPLGIGWAGVFAEGNVYGIEPLPILKVETKNTEFNRFIAKLQERVKILKAVGEDIPFSDAFFDSVVCGNVIDHTQTPKLIVQEAHRVLKPNGYLILTVNCFSVLGIVKWRLYTTKRFRHSAVVVAHPHSYLSGHIQKLLQAADFKICLMSKEPLLQRWAGHSHRVYVIAKKTQV